MSAGLRVTVITISGTVPVCEIERVNGFIQDLKKLGVTVEAAVKKPGWMCSVCGLISFHPDDALNEYCVCCGNDVLPKLCKHWRKV